MMLGPLNQNSPTLGFPVSSLDRVRVRVGGRARVRVRAGVRARVGIRIRVMVGIRVRIRVRIKGGDAQSFLLQCMAP